MKSKVSFKQVIRLSIVVVFTTILSSCGSKKAAEKVEAPALDLHSAVVMGDANTIQKHVEAGSNLDVAEEVMGSTPLMSAAVFDRLEISKILIEGGADLNAVNKDGSTALHSAAFLCRPEIVQLLVDKGADQSVKNNHGSTALESVLVPMEFVKPIYDKFNQDLGPLGFKLSDSEIQEKRPLVVEILK